MKRLISIFLAFSMLIPGVSYASGDIKVYLNDSCVTLDNPARMYNDAVMLPVRELLERMGFYVEKKEYERRSSQTKEGYVATVNNAEMIVSADCNEACYDEVWFELSQPTVGVENDILVPLEFISHFYKINAENDDGSVKIQYENIKSVDLNNAGNEEIEAFIATLPKGSTVLDSSDLMNGTIYNASYLTKKTVNVDDGNGFDEAVELETLKQGSANYMAQLNMVSRGSVKAGDLLILSFWAKSIDTSDESGLSQILPTFEEFAKGTYALALCPEQSTQLTGKWKKYYYIFKAIDDWASGTARGNLRVGYKPQTIQVAELSLINYHEVENSNNIGASRNTAVTYYGREDGALWREEALKRIEKYRVRDIKINITDENGNPIKDAQVNAKMTRSEFAWGSIAPVQNASAVTPAYVNYTRKWFNTYTPENAMKETSYITTNGQQLVDMANFVIDSKMKMHGHTLMYDRTSGLVPEILNQLGTLTEEEARRHYYEYASEIISFFGDIMSEVDVINELRSCHVLMDKFGKEFTADFFRVAAALRDEYSPDMLLQLNETGINGNATSWTYIYRLDELLKELKANGAVIDSIGHQVHTYPIYYPQSLYNQMDYSSELVDALELTEFDCVISNSTMSMEEKRKVEADYFRDMLILSYSHPKMIGFIMWGFFDSGHWRADSPMLTRTFNEKEGVKIWEELVMGEWNTDTSGVSDENGSCSLRGHRGDYEITVTVGGEQQSTTLKVSDKGENTVNAVYHDGSLTLESSENVIEKSIKRKEWKDLENNRNTYKNAYKKYLTNCIISAKDKNGENVYAVTDEKDGTCWNSENYSDALILELDKVYDSGTVNIKWNDSERMNLYSIETSSDGESWEKLEHSDGTEETRVKLVNRDTKYIRIKSLTDRSICIDDVSFTVI